MRPDPELVQDPRLEAHTRMLRGRFSPTAVTLAQGTAHSIDWRALGPPEDPQWTPRLLQQVRGRLVPHARNLGLSNDADIVALVFLVLMEAAKSAREDLKFIMAGVKSINAAKGKIRDHLLVMMAQSEGRADEIERQRR